MIPIKKPQEIAIMREGGRLLAQIMEELIKEVRPGVSTGQLDKAAAQKVRGAGAMPAFLNYQGFPRTMCTSVNEEVVHGIPSEEKILKAGDIITLDLGLIHKGYYSDMARTVPVGVVSPETARWVQVCREALRLGTEKARPGITTYDIGNTIQRFVESKGYGIVRELCGHGIGKELHEEPQVLNYGKRGAGPELVEGMVICIEPMITMGDFNIKRAKDGQTFVTRDGSLSAHFEDTVAVTSKGPQVLTSMD